jgi:hypothetical protein
MMKVLSRQCPSDLPPFQLAVAQRVRQLVTTLVFAEDLVLLGIRRRGGRASMQEVKSAADF